jgi:hypothetical protein
MMTGIIRESRRRQTITYLYHQQQIWILQKGICDLFKITFPDNPNEIYCGLSHSRVLV